MLSEKPWRPESVLRLVMWLFVSLAAGSLLISLLNPTRGAPLTGELKYQAFLISLVTFHGVSLLLVNHLLREHQVGWRVAFGFDAARPGRAFGLALVVACLAFPIAGQLAEWTANIMRSFAVQPEMQVAVKTLQTAETSGQRILFGVFALGVAPFVEEVLFRGIIYPAIKQNGYPRLAWGMTSLMFAATHSNLMTFLPLTLLALPLTWLYERTNNLLAPILAHSLFNAANFYWLLASQPSP
ncbi:MAG: CPBP family intramembrane metalloprotease [Pedosphaera parvula]|nr:CPBP family intramembrane metalloprotease [Pedosphaera parvula]